MVSTAPRRRRRLVAALSESGPAFLRQGSSGEACRPTVPASRIVPSRSDFVLVTLCGRAHAGGMSRRGSDSVGVSKCGKVRTLGSYSKWCGSFKMNLAFCACKSKLRARKKWQQARRLPFWRFLVWTPKKSPFSAPQKSQKSRPGSEGLAAGGWFFGLADSRGGGCGRWGCGCFRRR